MKARILAALALVLVVVLGFFAWRHFNAKSTPTAMKGTRIGPFDVHASLDPDPPRQNGNTLVLDVADADGKPVDDALVDVIYDMPAMGAMAEMKGGATVSKKGNGRYEATFDLPMNGTWTLRVAVDAPRGKGVQDFTMTVGSPGLAVRGADDTGDVGAITIDAARRQLIGVRTGKVEEAPMMVTVRAVGRIEYDETSLVDVSTKVRGWIVKLQADRTGQRVTRGQTLFTLYSPDLYAAQQDFLVASKDEQLAKASRVRLRLLGMSDPQIDALAKSGSAIENVAFPSPATGFIIEKNVVEGGSVEPGARLLRIAGLDKVWVEAEIYEADCPNISVGQHADVSLDYVKGEVWDGKVAYLYPYIDPKSRTGRARIELANTNLELRPGMYAHVSLHADLGKRVQVPTAAIVYTGPRRLVFVDKENGRFEPREIAIGGESEGKTEVTRGLSAGEIVATSGVFLIAAEARIGTAAKYWESADASSPPMPSHVHSAPSAPPPLPLPGPSPKPVASAAAPPAVIYTCPMHPEVQSPTPGNCPKCGMKLVPK